MEVAVAEAGQGSGCATKVMGKPANDECQRRRVLTTSLRAKLPSCCPSQANNGALSMCVMSVCVGLYLGMSVCVSSCVFAYAVSLFVDLI